MFNKIEKFVEFIENDYHAILNKEKVEEITGNRYQYFSREFKKITGMTPDKYRIRRQLYLIICEIKEDGKFIKNSNLEPWNNENSFHSAFRKEFGITPHQYCSSEYATLQDKLNIELLIKEDVIINTLKVEHKSYEGALKYLLSLPVYKNEEIIFSVNFEDKEEFYRDLVQIYYNKGKHIPKAKVSEYDYKKHINIISKYYDFDGKIDYISIDKSFTHPMKPIYFVVKRSLIKRLLELIDIDKFFNDIEISNIKTIWHYNIKEERKTGNHNDNTYVKPNELITSKSFSKGEYTLLSKIVLVDNGLQSFDTLESLKDDIKFNLDKTIETENHNRDEFELLEVNTLKETIIRLMYRGVLIL